MTSWVATAYGVLDVRDTQFSETGARYLVLGTLPSEPIGLIEPYASLWASLVAGPVNEVDMTDDEFSIVREFETAGIASTHVSDADRVHTLPEPWLQSPMHELVYSLISGVAEKHSIDLVFIKGPMLHKQGLRSREHSGDVDAWVSPPDIMRLVKHLEEWGWHFEPGLWGDSPAHHSLTLAPGSWGCEIDLHRHMPGCALEDTEAFRVLRENSETWEFASRAGQTPAVGAHSVLSALHLLRPLRGQPPSANLVAEAESVLSKGGQSGLNFSKRVRAVPAIRATLRKVFPEADLEVDYAVPLNWHWRAQKSGLRRTLVMLKLVPARERIHMLRTIVWPDAAVVLQSDRRNGNTSDSPFAARIRRLDRLLRRRRRKNAQQ